MPLQHALLSASGSGQWLNCPGSIRMAKDYPNESSIHAQEGTAAHALGEFCLKNDVVNVTDYIDWTVYKEKLYPPDAVFTHKVNPKNPKFTVDDEMATSIQHYVDTVRSYKGRLFVERRVDFSEWVPEGFGTSDAIVINEGVATAIDLKYGRGVKVDAFRNTQAMLYLVGVYSEYGMLYEIDKFRAVICQPRLDHVDEFEISREDLIQWAEKVVRPAALLALTEDAPLAAGEKQCRWCKARGDCSVYATWSLEKAVEGFEFIEPDMPLIKSNKLSLDELATLLPQLPGIVKWCKAIEESAHTHLSGGENLNGYKLVRSHTKRRWANEAEAEKKLARKLKKSERTITKLISPSQAEKLLGKGNALFEELVERPEGKPTVVPEYDKRPALSEPTAGFNFKPKSTKD